MDWVREWCTDNLRKRAWGKIKAETKNCEGMQEINAGLAAEPNIRKSSQKEKVVVCNGQEKAMESSHT